MKHWLRRIRGAVGMGLTWAAGGAVVGFGIELIHHLWPNPLGALVDIWPAALAFPAFLGGVVFSTVLGIAGRRRKFEELSLRQFAAWGALGGLLASLFPAAMVALGLATPNFPLWQITIGLAGPLTVGSAIAASASLAVARMTESRESLGARDDVANVGLGTSEAQTLLNGDG